MEWRCDRAVIHNAVKKNRWIILMLLLGTVFMLMPEASSEETTSEAIFADDQRESSMLQEDLERLLSQLEGAGKVRVLLTEAKGKQTIYQIQQETRTEKDSEQLRSETVILSGSDRGESGLISRIDPPQYLGAVVLCQGADKASTRLAIVDAVSAATGLGANKISVCKMK